ncbi:MAG: helix-turn-helix domain-containing protein [Bacteroidales bacterium]|jgi:hypothetical protein|nr:helix-turn-helix domain-containing protein [Bacteroidales bacterium]
MDIYKEIAGLRADVSSLKTILLDLTKAVSTIHCENYKREKRFLNAQEAAVYLEISESSFHRCKEKIPFVKKGKRFMYKVEDLDHYIEKNAVSADKKIDFTNVSKFKVYATA